MASMKTVTRVRSITDVRAVDPIGTPEEQLERALEGEAMSAAADLLGIFEEQRELEGLSKAEVGRTLGANRTAISRLLESDGANPTLRTITRLLYALGLHADITIRQARENEDGVIDVWDELEESELTKQLASGIDRAHG